MDTNEVLLCIIIVRYAVSLNMHQNREEKCHADFKHVLSNHSLAKHSHLHLCTFIKVYLAMFLTSRLHTSYTVFSQVY